MQQAPGATGTTTRRSGAMSGRAPARRRTSVLQASAWARCVVAGAVAAGLWLCVAWAMAGV